MALAVLALLTSAPMHPYRMQVVIKQWGKDQVINVGSRATLYKTIDRLVRDGLIRVRETERERLRPERTVYEMTDAGREVSRRWMREMLSAPRREFPEFPAAISLLPLLEPDQAREALETRRAYLEGEVARLDAELAEYRQSLPRVSLVEVEYLRGMAAAELSFVAAVVDDLRSGRLGWSQQELREAMEEERQ
ncbi:PadR family transcriptional regulator [Sphaerisporangium fuscum]|uniref:PadR family transcriptional regulator n=1 Tax=Sphaerisporangium fuscum TaxID=2835868 RepID=UPI002029A769|nr:PadR family transcriptional regulator [Sphaerisporangium fuscum]